jgi:hypothetical protein
VVVGDIYGYQCDTMIIGVLIVAALCSLLGSVAMVVGIASEVCWTPACFQQVFGKTLAGLRRKFLFGFAFFFLVLPAWSACF